MRIPYTQVEDDDDDDVIQTLGSIQTAAEGGHQDEEVFCPSRPLLRQWPFLTGYCQIIVGFVCAILGAVEIFIMPFLIEPNAIWFLGGINCFGAILWSGCMLIFSGGVAVRAAKLKTLFSVQLYFIINVLVLLFNYTMMVLLLTYSKIVQTSIIEEEKKWFGTYIEKVVKEYEHYIAIPIVGGSFCVIGCILLGITVFRHFKEVMCGEVKLLKSLGRCCCPCWCDGPPSQAGSHQSVNSNDSNMIV